MADYMDLVVVENTKTHRRAICRAPWLSRLDTGEQVRYQFGDEKPCCGEVVATMDISVREKEDIDFILACNGQSQYGLAKIISKIKVIDMKYEDDDDELHE